MGMQNGAFRGARRRMSSPAKLRGAARTWWLAVAVVVVAAGAWLWALVVPATLPDGASVRLGGAQAVTRGAYVARVGDCVACHTAASGSQPMAGGLPLTTPFGLLYSTNITPDKTTGIGNYSFEQFDRAMRQGIAADGRHLYPAMPYPSYARITDADMHDLYAYLMDGVPPVRQANKPSALAWPYNMRWGLALWNKVFLDGDRFAPSAKHDAAWNRGAYLIQGLGHCGACHTPRGIGFQEKTLSEAGGKGDLYLSGFKVESWSAPNLRNLWTAGDLVTLLKTGKNQYGVAAGGMRDVIHNSTQYMSAADLSAMAVYLKSLSGGGASVPVAAAPASAPAAAPGGEPEGLFATKGGLGYVQFCSNCHQTDGRGFVPVFPGLTQNLTVQADDPVSLIHIALTGHQSTQTETYPRVYTMPALGQLADGELADILSFVRATWGGGGKSAVTAAQVAALRKELALPPAGEQNFRTPRLAAMLDAPNARQVVRGLRLNLQTKKLLPDNAGNALNCMSCHLNSATVALNSPYVGVASQFPSYNPRAGKIITLANRINGCFLRSMNGKPLPDDSDEMTAMIAFFDWMNNGYKMNDNIPGRGIGKMDGGIKPNPARGKEVYAAQCASCHGADGQGGRRADGTLVYPPLWGDQSFNIGAGIARTYTAAAFVKNGMPISTHERFPLGQGGLSDQDAVDVSAYFTHQPRPDFAPKVNDWPKGDKPKDARY